jgi:predicted aspartyl protease
MFAVKILRLALIATLPFAALAGAQPVDNPPDIIEATDGPGWRFVITPSNPNLAADPASFELNDPVVEFTTDHAERMMMPVEIGGLGPYPFIIDTGSQRTIVARELAQRLALPELPSVEIISLAGPVTLPAVQLEAIQFGGHKIEALKALTIKHSDMGSMGVIGLDSLVDKRLTMDFVKGRMEIGDSRRAARTDTDDGSIVVKARSRYGQLILVNSRIDRRRVNVILDTGAELSVGNMALFRSLKTNRLVVPPQPTSLVTVTGVEVPAQFAVVRRLSIGPAALENVPMVFLDAAPFEMLGLGDKPAMLLGMGMLRLFDRVAIDFGHRHVDFHIAPGGPSADRLRLAEGRPSELIGQ